MHKVLTIVRPDGFVTDSIAPRITPDGAYRQAAVQAATLAAYAEAGVSRALLALPPADRDTVLRLLDDYAPLLG